MKPLVFVADAHLTRDDPEVGVLVAFLEKEGPGFSAVCILGDLFNLWFGDPRFALPHHREVLRALADVRRSGVRLLYVEGNRDFHLRRNHLHDPFDAVAEDSMVEEYAGRRIWATHGDAINVEDRPYRTWRAFSKSEPVRAAFTLLPGTWGMTIGESLERRLAGTNLRHKSGFPTDHCLSYARRVFDKGCHTLVLGHFHEERHLACGERDGHALGVYVLPAWRGSHRYLIFEGGAAPRFVTFEG